MVTGNYKFDLDNSIIFGVEREDDQIGYNKDLTGKKKESLFIQLQLILIIKKIYRKYLCYIWF